MTEFSRSNKRVVFKFVVFQQNPKQEIAGIVTLIGGYCAPLRSTRQFMNRIDLRRSRARKFDRPRNEAVKSYFVACAFGGWERFALADLPRQQDVLTRLPADDIYLRFQIADSSV